MLLLELLPVPGCLDGQGPPVQLDGDVVRAVLLHVERQLVVAALLVLQQDRGVGVCGRGGRVVGTCPHLVRPRRHRGCDCVGVSAAAGAGVDAAEGISSMVMPGIEGKPGISIPRMGGNDIPPLPPPSMEDIPLLIIEEEEDEEDEKDETDEEDIFDEEDPICIEPMFDIILLIMSSIPAPPPIKLMPPIEPMGGMAPPPEDIMVEEEEEEEVDLKLEIVLPSSDCVVAAML